MPEHLLHCFSYHPKPTRRPSLAQPTNMARHPITQITFHRIHLRTLALPKEVAHCSLTTLREKLVKIGAKVVCYGR